MRYDFEIGKRRMKFIISFIIGLFHFLSIKGCGRQIPWGSARGIFQGSQGLKLFFLGGKDKFSRGVILVRASQGKFSRGPA